MADKDGIEVVRTFTPEGDISVGYVKDGWPCMHAELTGPAATSAAMHQLVFKEMEFCEAVVKLYLDKVSVLSEGIRTHRLDNELDLNLRAAYISAVVTYAKSFSEARHGRVRLVADDIFKDDGSGYGDFHSWILKVHRHGYVAHSKKGELDDARTVLLFPPPFMGTNLQAVVSHASFWANPHPKDAHSFLLVIQYVKAWVLKKVKKHIQDIEHGISKVPINVHYAKGVYVTITPPPKPSPEIRPELATPID